MGGMINHIIKMGGMINHKVVLIPTSQTINLENETRCFKKVKLTKPSKKNAD
ncbi:hypothetical protein GCM10009410_24150 [Shewanella ulleungensis]|uniref:Uncharacterized protein n=1 Tax=Shewanella ulleungensis TaxID=2282699 RepID=A0ABQ2QNA3_9GAMM|nr:hypothetical protein GCM10009410_24150 [Shewanella ulleungensis]